MSEEGNIMKWLNGDLSPEEEKEFLKSSEYQSLKSLSDRVISFKAPKYEVEEELNRFKDSYSRKQEARKINWYVPIFRIAAAVTLIAMVYFTFFKSTGVEIVTNAGETAEVYLPDSSIVILNAVSSIKYDPEKWTKARKVELEGEAYFKVRSGSKFDVLSDDGTVNVLGTQFNVISRPNYFEVICYEGKVAASSDSDTHTLFASDAFRSINGEANFISGWHNDKTPSWLNNIISFESVQFQYVIDEFERQYDIDVQVQSVQTQKLFTGSFRNDNMELALRSICIPLKIEFEIIDKRTVILKGVDK